MLFGEITELLMTVLLECLYLFQRKSILVELEEKIKAEILVRLKLLDADILKTIDDIDLNKHNMSEIESRFIYLMMYNNISLI